MEEKEVLVKVEGVSKKFCKDLKTSLWYGVKDLVSNLKGNQAERSLREKEFWAVKDIDFELRRGECLGLIGHNGAGKSTLLKMLNGLINPDAGKITIKGRVGALIELGAGFNPILSGRENIYNNGAVLGFTRKEIEEKLEEIIDFAELREFIDMPVQNYSSGMKVRLGFAVAAQMEPDVLLIDEVLAVGDIGFRMKCLTRIGILLKNTAVIFVSHSMPQVSRIANKILLLNKGQTFRYGPEINDAVEAYYSSFGSKDNIVSGTQEIKILAFEILDQEGRIFEESNEMVSIDFNSTCEFLLRLEVSPEINLFEIHYSFIDRDTKIVATIYSYQDSHPFSEKGEVVIRTFIENLYLGQGIYTIGIAINEVQSNGGNGAIHYYNSNLKSIQIMGVKAGAAPVHINAKWQLE